MIREYFCSQLVFFYIFVTVMNGDCYLMTSKLNSKDVCLSNNMKIKVLALDFDKTCTIQAVLDIYKAREDYPDHQHILDKKWNEIQEFYSSTLEPILKPLQDTKPMATEFDENGLRQFLAEVSEGDNLAIDKLISSNILAGITPVRLLNFAQNVKLMPKVLSVLESLKSLHLPFHVISLNFSEKLIQYVLNREGQTLPVEIHTNKLQFKNGISTGDMDKSFVSAFDKEVQLQKIIYDGKNSGVTIYIGDSFTDLLALLKADIGIIIGQSKSMLKVCSNFGVHVVPLSNWSYEKFSDKDKKVLYLVNTWEDIQKFILSGLKCNK